MLSGSGLHHSGFRPTGNTLNILNNPSYGIAFPGGSAPKTFGVVAKLRRGSSQANFDRISTALSLLSVLKIISASRLVGPVEVA